MNGKAIDAYEAKYEKTWTEAPPHCQKMWIEAWHAAIAQAITVVETYRVSVGNSAAGEMAAELTMENLRELRDELREMVSNTGGQIPPASGGNLDRLVGGSV